ncbi:MAG: (2Fe-2S) ferredoxin domain-containing protein [Lutibacter sp.]|uniref:(2Fe-2S) ferredoxin domain-containing protein n=1 Tax=Lutibacter sp. TaxID=1925666 RepID=UPI001800EDB3|nr:(2Fe-2S) ferredoxin domain-containing protein [Lutibacter sp.]MBT8318389.1 (2Fe-2S) ferredoxin domain-containing protein [Lutibacter sp.]NNJ59247.1 (2Fe-2S) ferredoxin domain-containing protein [Lutibacter sp.]
MGIVKTVEDLNKIRNSIKERNKKLFIENGNSKQIQIKIGMATCGIASGAKEIMDFFIEVLPKRNINAQVKQTGCMGYCYAEPTIAITLPNQKPIVFGYVDVKKADEIIEKFIKKGELVDGIIPINYELAT